ncbi:MAG: hypothetical protein SNJ52_01750 [Verrucomicrobiia bacterium]
MTCINGRVNGYTMNHRSVHIAGGGLAGLTAAVRLSRLGIPVTVHEAGRYPRHRVCGEFLSGFDSEVAAQIGIAEWLQSRATSNTSIVWISEGREILRRNLEIPVFGISRYELDAKLVEQVRCHGGQVLENERCGPECDIDGWLLATGAPKPFPARWIGLKAHYLSSPMRADLEMHLAAGAYVGVSRIEDGKVNVCGLFRSDLIGRGCSDLSSAAAACRLEGLVETLATGDEVPGSKCACALPDYGWRGGSPTHRAAAIGDRSARIPPFTGHGMALAMSAGFQAANRVAEWAIGCSTWDRTRARISWENWRSQARPIATASLLHPMLASRSGRKFLEWLCGLNMIPFKTLRHLTHA